MRDYFVARGFGLCSQLPEGLIDECLGLFRCPGPRRIGNVVSSSVETVNVGGIGVAPNWSRFAKTARVVCFRNERGRSSAGGSDSGRCRSSWNVYSFHGVFCLAWCAFHCRRAAAEEDCSAMFVLQRSRIHAMSLVQRGGYNQLVTLV